MGKTVFLGLNQFAFVQSSLLVIVQELCENCANCAELCKFVLRCAFAKRMTRSRGLSGDFFVLSMVFCIDEQW
jgi:hypothetical protein